MLPTATRVVSPVRVLVTRYRVLPLGYSDAAVIACAIRNGRRVLTFDLRHFQFACCACASIALETNNWLLHGGEAHATGMKRAPSHRGDA